MTEKTKSGKTLFFTLADGNVRAVHTNQFRFDIGTILDELSEELSRPVQCAEIVEAYQRKYNLKQNQKEKYNLRDSVAQTMTQFVRHKLIFSKSARNRRFYGSFRVIDSDFQVEHLVPKNLWERILNLVYEAVKENNNEPVRANDVSTYAMKKGIDDISHKQIVENMWSLTTMGRLKIIDRIRGDGNTGRTYFHPESINPRWRLIFDDVTFIEAVHSIFNELWKERITEANNENRLVRPPTTAELQDRIKSSPKISKFSKKNWEITSALRSLTKGKNLRIRSISQRNGMFLWMPISCKDESLDLQNTYSSNALKVVAAVERAFERYERPVNTVEIQQEISLDENLKLHNQLSLHINLVSICVRPGYKAKSGVKPAQRLIKIAGRIDGKAQFAPINASDKKCSIYIAFEDTKIKWRRFQEKESLGRIDNCLLPSVKIGRTLLYINDIQKLKANLPVVQSKTLTPEYINLRNHLDEAEDEAKQFLHALDSTGIPDKVKDSDQGLNAHETAEFLAPFYPPAKQLIKFGKSETRTITGRIRHLFERIPNPVFRTKNRKDPKTAAQYLFELTDLLCKTALRWGGEEARYQANIALQELGNLRDSRFVVPALNSGQFEHRLLAISCLAFLRTEYESIRHLAVSDPGSEVRISALWALAFMNDKNYKNTAEHILRTDHNDEVRNFAEKILNYSEIEIWRI